MICPHCRNGFLGNKFGQDVECVNGVLIDIDEAHEGRQTDVSYPVAPCHPMWERQLAGDEDFPNDCQERLYAWALPDREPQDVAIRDWKFSQEGKMFVLRGLHGEGYELKENSIDALNRSVRRLINTLNALRDEYGFEGHLRHVYVQNNPLSGPVVRYCVYHKVDGQNSHSMADDRRDEWRYEIQHGPEGEANYSWIYAGSEMIATMQTHRAREIVDAMNKGSELELAAKIIEARLPLYTDIGQINALRECINSIREA